jgi:N-acetylmuramoyl-L-alanine amidase
VAGIAIAVLAGVLLWVSVGRSTARTQAPTGLVTRPVSSSTTTAAGPTAVALDPTEFADGACVAFAPTSGDRHQTVFLDAGHGGPDPGAVSRVTGNSVAEKELTLPVALDAAQLLRASGYRVVLSRTSDTSVAKLTPDDLHGALLTTKGDHADLIARVDCANLSGAAALVSVHFDAYNAHSVGGATTLYDPARPFSAANQALATALQQQILTSLAGGGWQVPDRGVTGDTTAGGGEITNAGTAYGHLDLLGPVDPGYVDNPTTMPGALVEPLFITNPTEAAIALNPTAQQAIAAGIAAAVGTFLQH